MLKVYVIIVFTLTITFTTNAVKEEDTENRAQNTYHGFDGTPNTYYFGYDSKVKDAPRLMREETRLSDGTVQGRYGYTDPFGVFRVVKYVSGNNGYYATEEIGEQVTSSTPQYYKATASQVESVSEEPVNYSIDLATKFNPPLYHPEAHTMSPDERQPQKLPEADNNEQPYSGIDTNNRNHQIFSLSNSEDILENKYRERKRLERTSRVNQGPNPVRTRQTISKRTGLMTPRFEGPPYEAFVKENKENNRRVNDLNVENRQNFREPTHHNTHHNIDDNDFLRRAPLQHQKQNKSDTSLINRFEAKEQNTNYSEDIYNKNNTNEDIVEVDESPLTEPPILITPSTPEKIERPSIDENDNLPDGIRHLYYRPTRSPPITYSTPFPRFTDFEIKNETENKTETIAEEEKQMDVWNRIRHLFRNGSPTTTESVPTAITELPNTTDSTEEHLPPNEAKTVFFSPIFIEDDHEILRNVPREIESSSKYFNIEPFHSDQNEEHFSERTADSKSNENKSSVNLTENYENIEDSVNTTEHLTVFPWTDNKDQFITTQPSNIHIEQDSTEFFTQSPRSNFEEEQNQSSEITKSAFFHEFLLNPNQNENNRSIVTQPQTSTNPSSVDQSLQTTNDNSLQNTEQNETSIQNFEKTETHQTNEKFLDHFWNNFNEQSVLFSEAQIHNQTIGQNISAPLKEENIEWISEQIDKKSIMFSEGRVDNSTDVTIEPNLTTTAAPLFSSEMTESTTQTTAQTTQTPTEVTTTTTTTTTPDITTTELINKEFLDNFWHNFNDNSDEYIDIVFENKTNELEQSTAHIQPNGTTSETITNSTTDNSLTETGHSFNTSERQDLIPMEDNNFTLNTTSPTFDGKFLPSIQPSEQNQYIPPFSALFEFPHMRKQVRRVKRLRNYQYISPDDQLTTTSKPEDIDIMSTDATEELTDIRLSDDDSTHLRTTASQRVYQYVPPYPVLKESYIEDNTKSFELNMREPNHFTQGFDDMSEIVTTIESMRKPKRPQTEDRPQTDPSKVVEFDDKPDSFEAIKPKTSRLKDTNRSQIRYLLPLEPQTDSTTVRQLPEVLDIKRNNFRAVHRYEPIIRLEV